MPHPSSLTRMLARPPSSTAMSIDPAPASREFSTSSLTTEAGRSTTSPAAIWSATALGRIAIWGTYKATSAATARSIAPDGDETVCLEPSLAATAGGDAGPYVSPLGNPHQLSGGQRRGPLGGQRRH